MNAQGQSQATTTLHLVLAWGVYNTLVSAMKLFQ